VFNAMLGKAMDLCAADFGVLNTFDGELFHTAATRGLPPAYDEYRRNQPLEYGPGTAPARLLQGEPIVEIPDLRESDAYRRGEPNRRALVDLGGARSILAVALLKNDQVVGNFMIFRQEPARFSEKQISLLKQFAAQAVIAIENTRLLRELRASTEDLRESLQQQTATADVLKVISRSAFDLNAVFQTVAESSVRLCGADRAFIFRFDGELLRMAVAFNSSPEFTEWVAQHPIRPGQHSGSARAALERRTIHIPDVLSDPNYSYGAKDVETIRTVLGVPILKGDDLLGVMMIYHLEVRPFTDKQIALVETFADQAAIAIENVRLFDEVNARTEDLRESLQQQTATADVLKVISRSAFDLQTVLDTLVESAARLCEVDMAAITRQKGDEYFRAGSYGFTPEFMDYVKDIPVKPERATITGRTLLEGTVIHVPDVLADPDYTFSEAQKLSGNPRTFLGVPLLREGNPVGALVLLRRTMRPFTDKQVELVTTFADQAVIAIENVRLFDEVQARTKELAASLDDLRTAQDRLVQTEKLVCESCAVNSTRIT
jgi:two-component system, NtrC family, sensor kinase